MTADISSKRIQLLLRPLRTAVVALAAELERQRTRQTVETRPFVASGRLDWSGNGRGKSSAERDSDWGKLASDTSASQAARRRLKGSTTYGAKKGATTTRPDRPTSVRAQGFKAYLIRSGLPVETITRMLAVCAAYKNTLDCVYGAAPEAGRVQSLVQIASLALGWEIEAAVLSCIAEQENQSGAGPSRRRQGLGASGSESDEATPKRRRTSNSRKSMISADLDVNTLVDEWYDACPQYCWRWVLVQHVTAIVLNGLPDAPVILLEVLLDMCNQHPSASSQASRFLPPLISAGLASTTTSAHALGLVCLDSLRQDIFLAALSTQLSQSPSDDRALFKPYLSLARVKIENVGFAVGYVRVIMEAAHDLLHEMALERLELDGVALPGLEARELDVVQRLAEQIRCISTELLASEDPRVQEIPEALLELIGECGSVAFANLAPTVGVFTVAGLMLHEEMDVERLRTMFTLGCTLGEALPEAAPTAIASTILSALHSLRSTTTRSLLHLATLLRSASLFHLECAVLEHALESYDRLCDVRPAAAADVECFNPPIKRSRFEDRLRDSEGECIQTDEAERLRRITESQRKGKGKQGRSYRYEDLIGWVATTPFVCKIRRANAPSPLQLATGSSPAGSFRIRPLRYLNKGTSVLRKPVKIAALVHQHVARSPKRFVEVQFDGFDAPTSDAACDTAAPSSEYLPLQPVSSPRRRPRSPTKGVAIFSEPDELEFLLGPGLSRKENQELKRMREGRGGRAEESDDELAM